MFTLYIANKNYSSWSLRPWILMRTLNIPFNEELTPLQEDSCWDKYREFSPNGLVPCFHDEQHIIWESLAITEYLAERHENVWPSNSEARDGMRNWYDEALKETWREPHHEESVSNAGVLIRDLRLPGRA